MLLPFLGLHFMAVICGIIISAAALIEPHHQRSAAPVGFSLVLAPPLALLLSFTLMTVVPASMPALGEAAFGAGYFVGAGLGICIGTYFGRRHMRHLINSLSEPDHDAASDEG